jgi:hypothetical protein
MMPRRKEKLDSVGFLWTSRPRGGRPPKEDIDADTDMDGCSEASRTIPSNPEAANKTRSGTARKPKHTEEEISSDKNAKKSAQFNVGSRVAVYWSDEEEYYDGQVTRKRKKNKQLFVEYDDGDTGWVDFDLDLIRQSEPPKPTFGVGSRIAVYWSDDEEFYSGQVSKRKGYQVFVDYDDGDEDWVDLKSSKIKEGEPVEPARKKKNSDSNRLKKIKKGSHVSVWWPIEKKYYPAVVRSIKDRKSKPHYLVYDDGDKEWTNLATRRWKELK